MKLLLLLITISFSQEVAVITFNSNISEVLNVELRSPTDVKYGETQIQIPGEYANIKGHKICILNAHVQDCFILHWSPLLQPLDTITVVDRSYTIHYTYTCNTKTEQQPIKSSSCIDVSPNPFSNHLAINIKGKESGILKIVTLSGQVVKSFHSSRNNPKGVLWNGTANNGAKLPNGIYVINYSDGKTSIQKRIVLQR